MENTEQQRRHANPPARFAFRQQEKQQRKQRKRPEPKHPHQKPQDLPWTRRKAHRVVETRTLKLVNIVKGLQTG